MFKEHTAFSYLSFYNIISSKLDLKPQVCAFITWKSAELFTSRLEICQDLDIQAIVVFKSDLLSILILNIYN